MLADFREAEDMINIGAYMTGSNPAVDRAVENIDHIRAFLKQDMNEAAPFEATLKQLGDLVPDGSSE